MPNYTLLPEQQEVVDFYKKRKWFFNSSDMGTGKTLMTLDIAFTTGREDVLIICPKSLIDVWRREILKHFNAEFLNKFTIINYEKLKSKMGTWDMVVIDEAHYTKNILAKRTDSIINMLNLVRPEYLAMLSGTPMINSAADYFPYFKIMSMRHAVFNEDNRRVPLKQWVFQNKYCLQRLMKIPTGRILGGQREFREVTKFYGVKNRDELHEHLKVFMKSVDSSKIVGHLKEVEHKIYIDSESFRVPKETKKQLSDLVDEMKRALDENDEEAFMTSKRRSAEIKTAFTVMLFNQLAEDGESTVIFTDHRHSCLELSTVLKIPHLIGGTTNFHTRDAVNKFNDTINYNGIVCTYKVGGEGHDFTKASRMIFNDLPFTYKDYAQAKARIKRKNQTKVCVYYTIFFNELDEKLSKMVLEKKSYVEEMAI